MKHLYTLLCILIMAISPSSYAQDNINKWAISFGANAIDTRTSSGEGNNWPDKHFSQPLAIGENWNILPSVSYLSVFRNVGSNLSVGLQGSANRLSKYARFDPTIGTFVVSDPGDVMYYSFDASVKYSFMTLIHSKVVDPSFHLGIGYGSMGSGFASFNPGIGFTFWVTKSIGISLESSYKKSFGDREDAAGNPKAPSLFQHIASLTFRFGGKDTDGDGIPDKDDACPNNFGLEEFQGCPDTDEDGIPDKDDACPTQVGSAELNGCPDKDKDGIPDKDDKCPTVAGLAALNGCPDKDGDGVADMDDKCPAVAGPKENAGCPWPDTDKDGVLDKDDDCPTVPGLKENKGCPSADADKDGVLDKDDECPNVPGPKENKGCPQKAVVPVVLSKLSIKTRNDVFFDVGKSTLKEGNAVAMYQLASDIKKVLKDYPNARFIVGGHTDDTGSVKINTKLSDERAKAVMQALTMIGISPNNLVAKGFGSSQPVASNKTASGRAENRRIEIRYFGDVETIGGKKK